MGYPESRKPLFDGDSTLRVIRETIRRLKSSSIAKESGEALLSNRLKELQQELEEFLWNPQIKTFDKVEVIRTFSRHLIDLNNELVGVNISNKVYASLQSISALLRIRLFSTDILTDVQETEGIAVLLAELLTESPYFKEKIPKIRATDIEGLKSVYNSLVTSATQFFLVADRLPAIRESDFVEYMTKAIEQFGRVLELERSQFKPRYLYEAIYEERLVDKETFLRTVTAFCSVRGQLTYLIKSLLLHGRYDEYSINLEPIGYQREYSMTDLIAFGDDMASSIDTFLKWIISELNKTEYFRGSIDLLYSHPPIKRQLDFARVNRLVLKNYLDILAHLNGIDTSKMLEEVTAEALQLIDVYTTRYKPWHAHYQQAEEEKHLVLIGELAMLIMRSQAALLLTSGNRTSDHLMVTWLNLKEYLNDPLVAFRVSDYTIYGRALIAHGLKNKEMKDISRGLAHIKRTLSKFPLKILAEVNLVFLDTLISYLKNEVDANEAMEEISKFFEEKKMFLPGGPTGRLANEIRSQIESIRNSLVFGKSKRDPNLEKRAEYFNPSDTETWIDFDFSQYGGAIKNVKLVSFAHIRDKIYE